MRALPLLTGLVLAAFAANSLLCRAALKPNLIDPVSFTEIRILAGAMTLWVVVRLKTRQPVLQGGNVVSAACLVTYALCFSLAYVRIDAGIGALILFGVVQLTLNVWSWRREVRPTIGELVGLAIALGGLVLLTLKGQGAPDPVGCALMVAAGVAWGAYSWRGRGGGDPILASAGNFVRGMPLALLCGLVGQLAAPEPRSIDARGILLAVASGSLTSGLGYALWYRVLPHWRATTAGTIQLAVPAIAVGFGAVLLDEILTPRAMLAMALILFGIAIAVAQHRPR